MPSKKGNKQDWKILHKKDGTTFVTLNGKKLSKIRWVGIEFDPLEGQILKLEFLATDLEFEKEK